MTPRFTFTKRARPFVEIGTGASNTDQPWLAQWDFSRWDQPDSTWAGTEPFWHDVDCETIAVTGECGRGRNTDRFRAGKFEVLLSNASGWGDPLQDEQPGELTLRPGRQVRYGVDHSVFGRVVLQRGWIDSAEPVYNPVEETDTVLLRCVDALGEVGLAEAPYLEVPVGANEFADQRFHRILDAISWPEHLRGGDLSGVRLVATHLGGQAADLLGQCGDSIGGAVCADTAGRLVLRNTDWQAIDGPHDGVIGNIEPGDVCPAEWHRPFDLQAIATRVILGRAVPLGEERPDDAVFDDPDALARYGLVPYVRRDLWTASDADIDRIGERLLETRGAGTMPRISGATLDAATGDDVVDLLTQLDVLKPSRYRCRFRRRRGEIFDLEHFATGWRLEMSASRWVVEVALDTAEPFAEVTAEPRWDFGVWDHTLWAA